MAKSPKPPVHKSPPTISEGLQGLPLSEDEKAAVESMLLQDGDREKSPPQEAATTSHTPEQTVTTNKMAAVRKALTTDPSLTAKTGVQWLKSNLGVEVSESMFANYKSKILAEVKGAKRLQPAPAARTTNVLQPAPRTAPPTPKPAVAGNALEVVRVIKGLLAHHSAEEIKELVDVLAE